MAAVGRVATAPGARQRGAARCAAAAQAARLATPLPSTPPAQRSQSLGYMSAHRRCADSGGRGLGDCRPLLPGLRLGQEIAVFRDCRGANNRLGPAYGGCGPSRSGGQGVGEAPRECQVPCCRPRARPSPRSSQAPCRGADRTLPPHSPLSWVCAPPPLGRSEVLSPADHRRVRCCGVSLLQGNSHACTARPELCGGCGDCGLR
jgi:hypothetical protein